MSMPNTAPRPPQGANRPQPQGANRPQPQGAANRPRPQASPGQARRRHPMLPFALCCMAALALGVVLQALMPNGFSLRGASGNAAVEAVAEIHASSTVQLNEIMSSNNRLFLDAAGNTPDWVELRNASDSAVDLAGWTLARNATESHMFVFPAQTLAPGECVLVFADSTYSDSADGYHAPFSLKAEGDTLMLFNPSGVAVEAINIPSLNKNTVYRRVGDVWEVSSEYTPGMGNTAESYQAMISAVTPTDVVISEVMAGNTSTLQAEDGRYYDYIELANLSGADVDIGGWYLSDSVEENMAWRIPDGTVIPAGGHLVFYASGNNTGLHTSFSLAAEGEEAVLSNRLGQVLSIADYDILDENQAYSRRADGSYTTELAPSPGAGNE